VILAAFLVVTSLEILGLKGSVTSSSDVDENLTGISSFCTLLQAYVEMKQSAKM
jgi:hypothetical protein